LSKIPDVSKHIPEASRRFQEISQRFRDGSGTFRKDSIRGKLPEERFWRDSEGILEDRATFQKFRRHSEKFLEDSGSFQEISCETDRGDYPPTDNLMCLTGES
jgi:hypothetical protein